MGKDKRRMMEKEWNDKKEWWKEESNDKRWMMERMVERQIRMLIRQRKNRKNNDGKTKEEW